MAYQILRRRDFSHASAILPPAIRRKADWAIVQLGVRGRTPSTKGTSGLSLPWRRSPVQGSHYYLWWINAAESGIVLNGQKAPHAEGSILVHSIRHHDETDHPLTVGTVTDYESVDVGLLDPRFDEQEEIALVAQEGDVTFTVIEGMPGSGKSVAILFLARDLATRAGARKVRYVTYTERLKRAAREIFDALGPEIAQHITVHTVNDVVKQLAGVEVLSSPYSEINTFVRDLEHLNPAQIGLWKSYPLTLYTELRAQIVGRTFPPNYQLPSHREEQMRRHGATFDVQRYARRRGLDQRAAEQSVQLAERLHNRYFLDQTTAATALARLNRGESNTWIAHTDALIIDEVQDFTLLQVALMAEIAAARRKAHPDRPLVLTVAGDESQIVQPTGFKWGVTKDLITDRLKVNPRDYHFDVQRRSPPLLARLTQASWGLYAQLPKDLRPSASQSNEEKRAEEAAADAESGLVIIAPPPDSFQNPDWLALLDELSARPGRALIDLTERLEPSQLLGERNGSGTTHDALHEVVFQAREIKGLERGTVLVYGLEESWQRVEALCSEKNGERIPRMEARRLIDQMRVALSRSTSRLIVLDTPDATIFRQLGFVPGESALQVALSELVELLQGEQMTDAEMVLALLDEAEDLAERGRMDDALRRNRRAASIAQQTAATDLLYSIHLQEGDLLMRHAERLLADGHIADAQAACQQADTLFGNAGAAAMQGERAERWQALSGALHAAAHSEFARLLDDAQRALQAHQYEAAVNAAFRAWSIIETGQTPDAADSTADGTANVPLPAQHEQDRTARALDLLTRARNAWAQDRSANGHADDSALIAGLLRSNADLHSRAGDAEAARIYAMLADRHADIPQRSGHSPDALRTLIDHTTETLTTANPAQADASPSSALRQARQAARAHAARWLDESYAELGSHVALYFGWATAASHLSRLDHYPAIDDRMWDLENRYEAAGAPPGPFAAFLAAYNGDPASASLIWEGLGEVEMAVESARNAGDIERAHTLLRTSHRRIPEELATAVKALRLILQLQQKHHALRPAEQRALAEELARLHSELTSETTGE